MNSRLPLFLLVAALVIGGGVYLAVYQNQSSLLTLDGDISALRLDKLSNGATLALVDFKATNTSDTTFEVRSTELALLNSDKSITPATMLSKQHATDYIQFEHVDKFNPLFGPGDVVQGHKYVIGTVVGQFPVPPSDLQDKTFRLKITSVNGIEVIYTKKPGEEAKSK